MANVDDSTGWAVVVNPNAGSRKALKDWDLINNLLNSKGLEFKFVFTEKRLHAFDLTLNFLNSGIRKFIVVGGDGTLNEVVNGIFNFDPTGKTLVILGLIPVGTGNDWGRMFHIPLDYVKAVETICKQKIFAQDIGVAYYQKNGTEQIRYFANIAGIGYDALVAKRTNTLKDKKWIGGPILYLYSLAFSLLTYKSHKAKIEIDDNTIDVEIFSLSVGIGKFNGGGMMQLPDAIADDGLFDLTIIRKISKLDVVKNIKNLYDGSFTRHPSVKTYKARKIKVEAGQNFYLEVDGESLGHTPFTFEILSQALHVISG
jgi:YegS/Rv2252/BmrU family lipid kinase